MTNNTSKIERKGCLLAQKLRRRRFLPESTAWAEAIGVVDPRGESLIVFELHSVLPSRLRATGSVSSCPGCGWLIAHCRLRGEESSEVVPYCRLGDSR